ncbi:MAG: hypothetical protein HQ523_03790 [Lentisphaerae bacterium]|nr:hypothetical protein [Lentisphaerota bacterium]
MLRSIKWHLDQIERDLAERISPDRRVLGGPFAGMVYPAFHASCSTLLPKLVGSYEAELTGAMEKCLSRSYTDIVNIGAGEGYYTIGCAMRFPGATIHAFECDLNASAQCVEMAACNKVADRVHMCGTCTPETLLKLRPHGRTLIICDCEGGERELVKPSAMPINGYDIIVEVHEATPNSRELLHKLQHRFSKTHACETLKISDRPPAAYPALSVFNKREQWVILNERRRPDMMWLFLDGMAYRQTDTL